MASGGGLIGMRVRMVEGRALGTRARLHGQPYRVIVAREASQRMRAVPQHAL
jgi:hypothetical protein